jgi:hypothetical protein
LQGLPKLARSFGASDQNVIPYNDMSFLPSP